MRQFYAKFAKNAILLKKNKKMIIPILLKLKLRLSKKIQKTNSNVINVELFWIKKQNYYGTKQ